jgi:phage-related tail fiber protein
MPTYKTILTTVGLQRLAEAEYAGTPFVFHEFAVGDGDGAAIEPVASMTELVRERYRADVNNVGIHADAPRTIRVEGLIPSEEGGYTIREAGLFNGDGELVAIASVPPTYKATPDEGVTSQQYIRLLIEFATIEPVELTVDPAVVMATREDVEDATGGGLHLWENFQ